MVSRQWIDDHCMSIKLTKNGDRKLISEWSQPEIWHKRGFADQLRDVMKQGKSSITECLYAIYYPDRNNSCIECGNPTPFQNFSRGYREYCSNDCVTHSRIRNSKISKTRRTSDRCAAAAVTLKRKNMKKYGVPYYCQTEEYKAKVAATKLSRYGDPTYNNMDKNQTTCMERYGVRSLFCDPEFQARAQEAVISKYGKCFPGTEGHSKAENELRDALEQSTGYAWPSTYSVLSHGLELDGYCKELNAAFEYCGLYWHSDRTKHRVYHRKKLDECESLGIRLFTVFEDEWLERQDQVIGCITSSVGIHATEIDAEECEVAVCESSEPGFLQANDFINKHHVAGASSHSKWSVALLHDGKIVAVATFSTDGRSGTMTMSRFASEFGINVRGAISRIIRTTDEFRENRSIDTWSDNRWSNGDEYKSAGMKLIWSRFVDYSFVTTKQKRMPKKSKEDTSGLYKIWDCGRKYWSAFEPIAA